MSVLEKQFEQELIKNCELAQKECGYTSTRFLQTIEKFGGVKTAQEILRKGRLSDGFEKLQQAGRIELTMEASMIKRPYAELFTDDEVNTCYEVLCEHGYYE
ncbi:MAG: hypothetical protein RR448_09785 [Niameybacter sp.]|uniref:hypothetical protein n=1 Tax=Niameybacter sp. TaxID=2033640 RepID=UPI002FC7DAEB